MPAGFQCKNADGGFQVTDDRPNYTFLEVVDQSDFATAGPYAGTAVFAWQPGDYQSEHYGDDWAAMNGVCYVFVPTNDYPDYVSPGFGLEIFNTAGVLMFSSALPPMRIVDYVTWTPSSGGSLVKTYTEGRSYAVILLREMIAEYGNSFHSGDMGEGEEIWTNTTYRELIDFKVEGHVVTFRYNTIETGAWESVETANNSGIYIPALATNGYTLGDGTLDFIALIVDVTGLT